MKSKVLSRFDAEASDEFKRDVGRLAKIEEEDLHKLLGFCERYWAVGRTSDARDIVIEAAERISASAVDVESVLDVLEYFGKRMMRKEYADDEPADIAADLVHLGLVSDERLGQIAKVVTAVKQMALSQRRAHLARTFQNVILPRVTGFGGCVEIRPVFDREAADIEKDDYEPDIAGVVPVVVFQIKLSSEDEFAFQVREEWLRIMTAWLNNLAKELEVAKGALKIE